MSYLGIADLSLEKKKKKIKVYNIFLIIMSSSHYLPLVVDKSPVTPFLCGGMPLTFGGIH